MANCTGLKGSGSIIKIKEETEFGLSEIAGFKKIFVKSDGVNYSQNQIDSELLTSGRSETKSSKGNIEVGGSIEVGVDNNQFGFWLKMLLGKVNSVVDGAKYKHTFTIADDCIPSFQKEKSLAGELINYKAVGLKADKLSVEFGGEGDAIATVDVIGKNEFEVLNQADSYSFALTADANLNSKTLSLDSVTNIEIGDALTIIINRTTLASDAKTGNSTINLTDASSFSQGDDLIVGGGYYKVVSVASNVVVLSRGLEKDILAGVNVFEAKDQNTIVSILGNDVTLKNGIKQDITVADTVIEVGTSATVFNDINFSRFDLDLISTNGTSITAAVETVKLDIENGSEAKRLLKDKGAVGTILEGVAKVMLEMNLILSVEAAKFIEDAKSGVEFDVTLTAYNAKGDTLSFIMPKGTLTPITPEISSPTAIEVSVEYKPFKTDTNESIVVELINDVVSY